MIFLIGKFQSWGWPDHALLGGHLLGDVPLALHKPSLYNNVKCKECFLSTVLGSNPLNIQFKKALRGDKWIDWLNLVHSLMGVTLTKEPDALEVEDFWGVLY